MKRCLVIVLVLLGFGVGPAFASCELGTESLGLIQDMITLGCSSDVVCPSPCPAVPACPACSCGNGGSCEPLELVVDPEIVQCKRCRSIGGKTRCRDCVVKFYASED